MNKFKKIMTGGAATAILLGNVAMPAFAAAFTNGSFETGTNPNVFLVVNSGATDIDSWNVDSGSVDYIGTYWTAADGSRSLDLSGNAAGTISQSFDTVIGATYTVTFKLSGNPAGGPTVKTLDVSATGGATTGFSYDTADKGNTLNDMKWETKQYQFVATASTTLLTFASTTSGFYGPALDDVKIVEDLSTVPTPTPTGPTIPEECDQNLTYNVIQGTSGSDVLNGTSGPDLIYGSGGSDVVNGKGGNDCIMGEAGSDLLLGGIGDDVILGGNESDSINGNDGSDKLYGENGSDSLKGGADSDELYGGAGSDAMQGEGGNDTLLGDDDSDSANGNGGTDVCSAEAEKNCEQNPV